MSTAFYEYQRPQNTYTLEQFIACQSNTDICYNNFSFIDERYGIKYNTYNVLSDYLEEIKEEYCVTITLSEDDMLKYKYRPKLLCYKIYGSEELAFIILILNDMCNVREFTKNKILMPTVAGMKELTKYIFNTNKSAIDIYNDMSKNKNE